MPIKLKPPRKENGETNYRGVGTYLGIRVDKSTGAARPALAKRIIAQWERDIERGRFEQKAGLTFTDAAVRYIERGGDKRPVSKLIAHFRDKPLRPLDLAADETLEQHWQHAIDAAATVLFPAHSAATRNREVYTPCSAILKCGGLKFPLTRPEGSRGRELTGWLWPEQAEALLIEAAKLDTEFGLLCMFLLYTGLRLSEGARWFTCDKLRLQESYAFIPRTKNGEPRPVFLPPHLVAALANHPRGLDRGTESVFRFHKGGRLYDMLNLAAERAGVALPHRSAFHILRHTYGAWMRRYAGMDTSGLVATGAWKSRQAAARYEHTVVSEEAQKAVLLPAPKKVG